MVDDIHQLEIGTMNCLSLVSLSDSTAYNTQRVQRRTAENVAPAHAAPPDGERLTLFAYRTPRTRAHAAEHRTRTAGLAAAKICYIARRAEHRARRESNRARVREQ